MSPYSQGLLSLADPSGAWNDEMRQRAAMIERLKTGEKIDGWRYDPGSTARGGENDADWSTPEGAWNGNEFYFAGNGAQQRNEGIGTFLKDAGKLAAVMGTAYLGGTALAGMGGAGAAGLTGVDAAMADLAASGGLTPASMASAGAGSLTAAGAGGAGGLGLTGVDAAMADLAASGGLTPASMGGAAGSTFGSALGSLGGRAIGGLLGAAAGAANSGDKTQTSQQRLDPRMEAMLYGADGKSGYLGAATDWFNQNKGGNPLMLQGAQMMADHYRSPQYTQGYNAMRDAGLGLLGTPRAGNPFTRGG